MLHKIQTKLIELAEKYDLHVEIRSERNYAMISTTVTISPIHYEVDFALPQASIQWVSFPRTDKKGSLDYRIWKNGQWTNEYNWDDISEIAIECQVISAKNRQAFYASVPDLVLQKSI